MRKPVFLIITITILCTLPLLQLVAQPTSITYHELPTVSFRNPVVIGKTDNGFALTDFPTAEGTPVYFVDSSLQLIRKLFAPIAAYDAMGYTTGNGIHFIWQERSVDSVKIKMVKTTDDGTTTAAERKFLAPGISRIYKQMVSDKKNQRFFFHTWFINSEQLVLKGVLLDSSLRLIQEIESGFAYDSGLQRQTQVLLDVKGNLHIALYDKLTNYRLSASIQLQTIPLGARSATSETFQFEKAKLYDLIFFDNPATEQVQLAGFYYDGSTKIKTGLASIRFPYERKKTMHENFMPFSPEQRINLLVGMEHVRKKNDVMDFIKLKDIIEEDGQIFLSAWVLDIPNYLLVKDNEKEKMRNTEVMDWIRPDKAAGTYTRRNGNINRRNGTRLASDPLPNEVTNMNNFNYRPYLDNNFRSLPIIQNNPGTGPGRAPLPVSTTMPLNWISPKKFAFFSLDAGNDTWMQVLPANFPVASASYQPAIWDYPLIEKGQLYFIHLQQAYIDEKREKAIMPTVSLVNVASSGATVTPDTTMNLLQMRLGKPFKIKTGKYLLPYQWPGKKQNGLAVFEIKP